MKVDPENDHLFQKMLEAQPWPPLKWAPVGVWNDPKNTSDMWEKTIISSEKSRNVFSSLTMRSPGEEPRGLDSTERLSLKDTYKTLGQLGSIDKHMKKLHKLSKNQWTLKDLPWKYQNRANNAKHAYSKQTMDGFNEELTMEQLNTEVSNCYSNSSSKNPYDKRRESKTQNDKRQLVEKLKRRRILSEDGFRPDLSTRPEDPNLDVLSSRF